MKLIRFVLGNLILFFDFIFTPKSQIRSIENQGQVDQQTRALVLYHLNLCPFCVKVRRQIKRLGLNIAMKDVGTDSSAQAELMAGGKIDQVPCLRETDASGAVRWIYESDEINEYLQKRFA